VGGRSGPPVRRDCDGLDGCELDSDQDALGSASSDPADAVIVIVVVVGVAAAGAGATTGGGLLFRGCGRFLCRRSDPRPGATMVEELLSKVGGSK
jgi:hypothetical protein